MALPQALEARPFYQSAKQRFEDAQFLLEAERTTGAVYLAGYSVECMLKALILSITPAGERGEEVGSFRGAKAHDFDWLKMRYFAKGGPSFPSSVSKNFALVNTWTTDLRYKAGTLKRRDAEAFLGAAQEIITWADGRF
jgi:HEPN domain-containing protein